MRRRKLLLSVGLVVGFIALVLVGIVVAARRVPDFYAQAEKPDDAERMSNSREAVGSWFRLQNALSNLEPDWKVEYTADQVNSYFQDDFVTRHGGNENLPEGLSAPRIQIEGERMRLGVRYGEGFWSTILSIQVKVWLVPGRTNVMAMEILSLKAGALPLPPTMLLDKISQAARRENIDVTWFREDGHPVAIMRFQSDLTRPTLQFEQVDLSNGKLKIVGRSADPFAGQRRN